MGSTTRKSKRKGFHLTVKKVISDEKRPQTDGLNKKRNNSADGQRVKRQSLGAKHTNRTNRDNLTKLRKAEERTNSGVKRTGGEETKPEANHTNTDKDLNWLTE